MRKVCLVFFLFASVYAESVRQTETWMPTRPQVAMTPKDLVSSGDSPNGSDFEFPEEDSDLLDNEDDENEWDYSGSGDEGSIFPDNGELETPEVDVNDNTIPEQEKPVRLKPTISEMDIVQKNEVGQRAAPKQELESNVLMSHAGNESYFSRTEVLAALIAGSTVGLLFAILLILLLVYRMKKKDEGSYDLGKKPIYKKAATTEIYA